MMSALLPPAPVLSAPWLCNACPTMHSDMLALDEHWRHAHQDLILPMRVPTHAPSALTAAPTTVSCTFYACSRKFKSLSAMMAHRRGHEMRKSANPDALLRKLAERARKERKASPVRTSPSRQTKSARSRPVLSKTKNVLCPSRANMRTPPPSAPHLSSEMLSDIRLLSLNHTPPSSPQALLPPRDVYGTMTPSPTAVRTAPFLGPVALSTAAFEDVKAVFDFALCAPGANTYPSPQGTVCPADLTAPFVAPQPPPQSHIAFDFVPFKPEPVDPSLFLPATSFDVIDPMSCTVPPQLDTNALHPAYPSFSATQAVYRHHPRHPQTPPLTPIQTQTRRLTPYPDFLPPPPPTPPQSVFPYRTVPVPSQLAHRMPTASFKVGVTPNPGQLHYVHRRPLFPFSHAAHQPSSPPPPYQSLLTPSPHRLGQDTALADEQANFIHRMHLAMKVDEWRTDVPSGSEGSPSVYAQSLCPPSLYVASQSEPEGMRSPWGSDLDDSESDCTIE